MFVIINGVFLLIVITTSKSFFQSMWQQLQLAITVSNIFFITTFITYVTYWFVVWYYYQLTTLDLLHTSEIKVYFRLYCCPMARRKYDFPFTFTSYDQRNTPFIISHPLLKSQKTFDNFINNTSLLSALRD